VTLSIGDLDQHIRPEGWAPDPQHPANMRAFYSPIDDVHAVFKTIIGSCRHSIALSMYGLDDDELVGMIAHLLDDPTVYCQITLDSSQAGGVHEKALLEKYRHEFTGNSVAIGRSERGAIVHRKMVLVDGLWYLGGSTNWSTSGETLQDNELVVIQSASVVARAASVLSIAHDAALQQMAKRASAAAGTATASASDAPAA
jgi:phosphatidylserine/phosphatidylglycerophosphate/cardiolipin synthase-like enzyme